MVGAAPVPAGSDATDPAPTDSRVARTRRHVLAHARDLLTERGPPALTYTELAARARVTRQTLYRHWPTRDDLLVDLILDRALTTMPAACGSAQDIVHSFLRTLRDNIYDPTTAGPMTALIAQADHAPGSRAALATVAANIRDALNAVLEPTGVRVDADQYARLCGPIFFSRLFTPELPTDHLINHLIDTWSPEH